MCISNRFSNLEIGRNLSYVAQLPCRQNHFRFSLKVLGNSKWPPMPSTITWVKSWKIFSFPAKVCDFPLISSCSTFWVMHSVCLTVPQIFGAAIMSASPWTFLFSCWAPQFLLLLRWLALTQSWPLMHPGHRVLLRLYDITTSYIVHYDKILLVPWCWWCFIKEFDVPPTLLKKLRGSIWQWAQIKDSLHAPCRALPYPVRRPYKKLLWSDWNAHCPVKLLPVLPAWNIQLNLFPVVCFGKVNVGLPCTIWNNNYAYSPPTAWSQALFSSYGLTVTLMCR